MYVDGQADELDSVNEIKAYQDAWRCEQSDMVMVLLNLAVIPDEVIQKNDFKICLAKAIQTQ